MNIALIIVSGFLFKTTVDAGNRVQWSIMWSSIFPWQNLKFIATASWKLLAIGNPTIGLGCALRYTWHVEQFSVTFLISFFKSVLSHHRVPALFNKQISFSDEGWANCWYNFKAIVLFDFPLMLLVVRVIAELFSLSMLLMACFADVTGMA